MNLEGKVLSSVLNDKQIHILLQGNAGALFKTHSDVWGFILHHYDGNKSLPSPDLIKDKFPDFDYYANTEGTKYHLEELRNHYLEDGVRSIIRNAAQFVQDGRIGEALDGMINYGSKIKQMATPVRDVDISDTEAAVSHIQDVVANREKGSLGIRTGLPAFDACLPAGIYPGHLGILLAYPGIGKSWIMAYLAVRAWLDGKTPMIISLEMTEEEVRDRLYTIIGSGLFSHRKLSAGYVDVDDFRDWHEKTFKGKPSIHIVASDAGAVTPSVVKGKIDQYKPDIVFLDYLNLMSPDGRFDGEIQKMKQLSTQLKMLAKSERVPIVAISSATPDDVTDMSSAPSLGQVSWSKQISYDADWLVALGREPNSDVMHMVFRKNRHGASGEFAIIVDFDKGLFTYRGID